MFAHQIILKVLLLMVLIFAFKKSIRAQWNQVRRSSVTFEFRNAGIGVHGSFVGTKFQGYLNELNSTPFKLGGTVELKPNQNCIKSLEDQLRDKNVFYGDWEYQWLIMNAIAMDSRSRSEFNVKWSRTMNGIPRVCRTELLIERNAQKLHPSSFTVNRCERQRGGNNLTMIDPDTIQLRSTIKKAA